MDDGSVLAARSVSAPPVATWRASLGLALIMCGQPIGWGIRGQFVGGDSPALPGLIVVIGLALMCQPGWMVRARLYCSPSAVALPALLLLPFGVLGILGPSSLVVASLIYAVVVLAVLLILAATSAERLDRLPEAVLLIGAISSAVPLVQLVVGGAGRGFFRLAINGNDNTLITGSIGGMTVIAGLIVGLGRSSGIVAGVSAAVGTVAGLVAMVLTNTRSAIGMLVICAILYVGFMRRRTMAGTVHTARPRAAFGIVVMAGALLAPLAAAAVLGSTLFGDIVDRSWQRFLGAFAVVDTGSSTSVDVSTLERGILLRQVWDRLSFGGRGFMAQAIASGDPNLYPHMSYAQAFYDLGFVVGALYLGVALIVPGAMAINRIVQGPASHLSALVILLFVYSQGDQFAHTTLIGGLRRFLW